MEKFQKSDQLYKHNKFVECCDTLKKLLPHLTGKCTTDAHFILECIINNNLNVCSALAEVFKKNLKISWEPKLESFVAHYNNWKSFHVLPMQLRLTLAYNALQWYWMMPKSLELLKDKYYYKVLAIAQECLEQVLEELKVNVVGNTDLVELEETLKWLMETASNHIPKLNKIIAIALIKLLNILYLLFMKNYKPNKFFWQPDQSIENVIQEIGHFVKSLKNERKNKSFSVTSTKSGYYTLGFKNLNSTLDDSGDACTNSFILTCILNLMKYNRMEASVESLRSYEIQDSFTDLSIYLKAYSLFQIGNIDEAFLSLSSMHNLPMNDYLKFHFHILLGRYFSKKKMPKEATTEFVNAKNISLYLAPEALYYLFRNCQRDNLLMQVHFLDEIYQSIKKTGNSDYLWKMSEIFEVSLLNMLHVTPAISEEEVIYLLAKVNLEHQKFTVAETFYLKLLEILKTSCHSVNCDFSSRLAPLPKVHIIYHEAIKSSIERENLNVALKHCQSCFSDFIPTSNFSSHQTSVSNLESTAVYYDGFLDSLNEDCISLILMSQIYFQMNADANALNSIEKCIQIVTSHTDSKRSWQVTVNKNTSDSEEIIFFKCLLAKLFLCKAILLKNMGKNSEDIIPLYQKALSYNNGDSDVLHYYAHSLITQGQDEEATILRNTERFDLDINRCYSEALKSFLKLHTSDEKWGESDSPDDIVADLFENSGTCFDF